MTTYKLRSRRKTARRGGVSSVLMRELPGRSVIHRLWAGTKLICLVLLVLDCVLLPGWASTLMGSALVLGTGYLARVPRSALPRLPTWVWIFMLAMAVVAYAGHGLSVYLQTSLLIFVMLGAGALISWTTPTGQIAPAFAILGAPLKKLRVPVDEWAVTIALCMRSLPLLLDECRVLFAARRLRPQPRDRFRLRPATLPLLWIELIDILTATMAVCTRRAAELGQAITARGGVAHLRTGRAPVSRSDAGAISTVILACTAVVALSLA
jgi:energy-coupling factor transport system permease protein